MDGEGEGFKLSAEERRGYLVSVLSSRLVCVCGLESCCRTI